MDFFDIHRGKGENEGVKQIEMEKGRKKETERVGGI